MRHEGAYWKLYQAQARNVDTEAEVPEFALPARRGES
jgi:hypothetical protein